MGFKKLIIFSLLATLSIFNLHAENHDAEQNIIEKAKEINQKVKEKQAKQKANISSEIGKEEPLPLNDPFVGDASLGGAAAVSVITNSDEERAEMSLYNFKLVGIMTGEYVSYVSLINAAGEIVTLEGPSGIGKTTLVNLIAGFLQPEKGEIYWHKERIDSLDPVERPVSTIFQTDNLFEHLSCFQNVSLASSSDGKISNSRVEQINNYFLEMGIGNLQSRFPGEISGGQQARVSIVRALLANKPILLLDEPVSSLDERTRFETLEVIKKTALKYNLTLIIVSHQKEDRKFLNARQIRLY
mgnify:CR=1 FL=1